MLEYWLITKPTEEDNIVLDIRNMHLETSFDCSYDKLTIYDGKYVISFWVIWGKMKTQMNATSFGLSSESARFAKTKRIFREKYKNFIFSRHYKI